MSLNETFLYNVKSQGTYTYPNLNESYFRFQRSFALCSLISL